MNSSLGRPSRPGGPRHLPSERTYPLLVVGVLLLVVAASAGLLAVVAPGHAMAPAPTATSAPRSAEDPATHGDLVVTSGQTFVIQPTLSGPVYYQGGNITVESGGTLIVRNVTLSFVSYVSDIGNAEQRLSHIFHFDDNGTVHFYNATLTTDVLVLNAYAKLNFTVTGLLTGWNATFAFPGWLRVVGPTAVMTLNESTVIGNPEMADISEPPVIYDDTLYSPTLAVLDGAKTNLFATSLKDSYADAQLGGGIVRPTPLYAPTPPYTLVSSGLTIPQLGTSTDSASLALDWAYPEATARSGYFNVSYIDLNGVGTAHQSNNTLATVQVTYDGNLYTLGTVFFVNSTFGILALPFPSTLLSEFNATGLLDYLNFTGDFGTSSAISLSLTSVTGPDVNLTGLDLQMNTTGVSFNDGVSGSGSTLSAVDSSLDFNWAFPPGGGNPYSMVSPYPWESNKLLFTDGAVGYLANVTTPTSIPGVFSSSAILPDATSTVYLYRWAQFNLTGRGGVLPIQGATVSAYYAYNTNQANNKTVTDLNDLATVDPAIWGYVQYWDSYHGVTSYGHSNAAGQGFLLLASGNITQASLPDGLFLGGYHIGISVPAVGVTSHWFNWSVSPYPSGVAFNSGHFGSPDFGPAQQFLDYYGAVTVTSLTTLANGLPNASVDIGQTLGVKVVATDAGTATITEVAATLYYNDSGLPTAKIAEYEATGLDLTAPGQATSFNLTWLVNDNVTGLHGWSLQKHNLTVVLDWNYNTPSLGGGNASQNTSVNIDPSQIKIAAFTAPPTSLVANQQYFSTGTLYYNGTTPASVELIAIPVGGGANVTLAVAATTAGPISLAWTPANLIPGTSYELRAVASYNGRLANSTLPGTYSVPPPPTSPANFLFQKFLGLPIWLWLAIAAAAIVGIVLFLLFARRQAAGKLVECGECGNLIPEDATVCPKCGAEFESDLIRCSRCASTIPADSKFCPECAAQLLGTPGEAASDPEKQAYADFTEKYRAEAKRELGDNYSEGAFWDWWKRQPSYTPFSQWSLQQGQGTARAGMTAPPTGTETKPEAPAGGSPPKGGTGWTEGGASAAAPTGPTPTPAPAVVPPPAAGGAGLKACPNCGKEIPTEYLVCPFCNAVTQ